MMVPVLILTLSSARSLRNLINAGGGAEGGMDLGSTWDSAKSPSCVEAQRRSGGKEGVRERQRET